MKSPLVLHLSSGPASTEYARLTGMIQQEVPGIDVSFGTLTMQDSLTVSAYLYTTVPYWPDGSVFLSLIHGSKDPGTTDAVAIRLSNNSIILSPNNGTATLVAKHLGIQDARAMDTAVYGDDAFAIVRLGAKLAAGLPFEKVGALLKPEEICLFPLPEAKIQEGLAEGQVAMLLKTFGNLTFTIGTDEFEATGIRYGDSVRVTFTKDGAIVYQEVMTFQKSFGYVPEGAPVIFNGSSGYLDIGLNKKSFIDVCLPDILTHDPLDYKVRIEKL